MVKPSLNHTRVLGALLDGDWVTPTLIAKRIFGANTTRHSAWAAPHVKTLVLGKMLRRREPGEYQITPYGRRCYKRWTAVRAEDFGASKT
jgi:hypothetical protein